MIGYDDSDFETVQLTEVEQILKDFGNEMQSKLRQSLEKGGRFGSQLSSGELWQSIKFETTVFASSYNFQLSLADYYDYVNKGVKGLLSSSKSPNSPYKFGGALKPPSSSKLELWAKTKGLNPFSVAKSIREKGTYGSGFYDRVVTEARLKQLSSDLSKATKEDVRIIIDNTVKGVFGKVK